MDGQHGSVLIGREAVNIISQHAALNRESRSEVISSSFPSNENDDFNIGSPLFLFIASQAPHLHFTGAPEVNYLQVDNSITTHDGHILDEDDWNSRREVAALVRSLDTIVGQVEDTLIENAMWDNTLFIFTSDNGPEGGGGRGGKIAASASAYPFRGRKRTVWEGGTRSVTFMHSKTLLNINSQQEQLSPNYSTIGSARVFQGLFHFVDWTPTLLHAATKQQLQSNIDTDIAVSGTTQLQETSEEFIWQAHGDDQIDLNCNDDNDERMTAACRRREANGMSAWNEIVGDDKQSSRSQVII